MSSDEKSTKLPDGLIDELISSMRSAKGAAPAAPAHRRANSFAGLSAYKAMQQQKAAGDMLGIPTPYYRQHDAMAGRLTQIGGREVLNFTSYDYLGLNGHPDVQAAAIAALNQFGTSVSGSRITSGEREVHALLERALADLYETDDAVVFVSGHATAVSTLATLLGPKDLLIHDAFIHNCITVGGKLSGAVRRPFAHNDLDHLERLLAAERSRFENVLIVTEGLFSMDGDGPDLAALVELKDRFGCWLMVDDAHGLGVLGDTGRGIGEHCGVDPKRVDIWLGTLSKTAVSCGGYVAGSGALVDLLKFAAPGLVYSVGMPAPAAAAALAALSVMLREPDRVQRLQENGRQFIEFAKAEGLDCGLSWGQGIVPIIVGDALRTVILAEKLLERGIYAFPVLPPGVPDHTARLRFFMSAAHTLEDLAHVAKVLASELHALEEGSISISNFAELLAVRAGTTPHSE